MTEVFPSLEELVDPRRAAVMVIDVQNDFCDVREFPAAQAMLPRLQAFLSHARGMGMRLVYTRAAHTTYTDSPVWVSRYATRPHRQATCRDGSPGAEIHPSIAPCTEDIVVTKHRYNAFLGTDLEMILRVQGIESLLCTGIATNVCVENTAREAFQRDFWTTMVADCMAAHSERAHEVALENARRGFGRVVTSEQVAAIWNRALASA